MDNLGFSVNQQVGRNRRVLVVIGIIMVNVIRHCSTLSLRQLLHMQYDCCLHTLLV